MAIDPIDPEVGRSADEWESLVAGLPPVPDPWPPIGPIVLVAPHPDDELLGAGATLAAATDKGIEIRVLAATDGEMSHPHLSAGDRVKLKERRLEETVAAYALAGIRADRFRLSLSDGGADGLEVLGWETDLASGLAPLLSGAAVCFAPWASDGHPDHDACGRVARLLCDQMSVPLFEFPVWSWNWDDPFAPEIPFEYAVRHDVDVEILDRKQAGIGAYESQVEPEDGNRPVLPSGFLQHFVRSSEVFLLPDRP